MLLYVPLCTLHGSVWVCGMTLHIQNMLTLVLLLRPGLFIRSCANLLHYYKRRKEESKFWQKHWAKCSGRCFTIIDLIALNAVLTTERHEVPVIHQIKSPTAVSVALIPSACHSRNVSDCTVCTHVQVYFLFASLCKKTK